MASGFWGVTGFFIALEVLFALCVVFTGGKKDEKQCVYFLCWITSVTFATLLSL
jgi:hypothetical protein